MSLIVLYFLHSTSVLSFYIDVVLTLSISKGGPRSYIPYHLCNEIPKQYIPEKIHASRLLCLVLFGTTFTHLLQGCFTDTQAMRFPPHTRSRWDRAKKKQNVSCSSKLRVMYIKFCISGIFNFHSFVFDMHHIGVSNWIVTNFQETY